MEELVKLIDERLEYVSHEIRGERIEITAESSSESAKCTKCGMGSTKIHSRYERKLQDLPISGKKAKLILLRRKFFCQNPDCPNMTFAEGYSFFEGRARKTKRLEQEILQVSVRESSAAGAEYLRKNVADIGKSTICNLLKKTDSRDR